MQDVGVGAVGEEKMGSYKVALLDGVAVSLQRQRSNPAVPKESK